MSAYPQGSEWRMWDLHIHTPDSIVEYYTGHAQDRWPRFIDELESLPADIAVVGINDYWFLDGYRKVRAEKDCGRLPNIVELFPVVEVRCDAFSGVEGALKRLNLHLILDPLEPIDDLEQQLGSVLRANYRLTPDDDPTDWNEVPTHASMERLGRRIRESTPEDKTAEFEDKSDLEIGFNNLNVSFEAVRRGIADNTYLRQHVMLALGKVEWNNIKWNVASIANKKTFVNNVQAVFTAAKTREAFGKSLSSLKDAGVRHSLLDCSDAHAWSDSDLHNRLGSCFTWVNADPTFKGLRQALQEYDQRVTTNERPEVLTRIAQSPRSVITEASLSPLDPAAESPLFSSSTPLNPGFVVVIGNKGQGKSAFLDSVALAANSDRYEDFSFLNTKRFRAVPATANSYRVDLKWADGSSESAELGASFAPGSPMRVDYLPQSLIEKVCSADPNSVTKRDFEAEIERVVFRYIDDDTRGPATSLRQFLQEQGEESESAQREARIAIADAAADLSMLRTRRAVLEALDLQGRDETLRRRLDEVRSEILSVAELIDSGGSEEQQKQAAELRVARDAEEQVREAVLELKGKVAAIDADIEDVTDQRAGLVAAISDARALAQTLAAKIGVTTEFLFNASFEESVVEAWVGARTAERTALAETENQSGGLSDQLAVATRAVADKESGLQSVNDEVQALLVRQSDLNAQVQDLLGEPGDTESLRGVEALKAELDGIPAAVETVEERLHVAFHELHRALVALRDHERAAYEPATQFVQSNKLAKAVELAFDVEFRVRDFADRWLVMVNRQRLGHFHDMSRPDRDDQLLQGLDLDNADNLLAGLNQIVDQLGREGGKPDGDPRPLDAVMRSGHSPPDLLSAIYGLEWLHSQYIIRSAGKELSELSPGQRGLVLLLFYLLVDKSERPLLLDQPEENLDNQTVRTVLVPALREAVRRRQVIAVTHNPNFAVVGDADQIIVATFDGQFHYKSGSLAEIEIGQSAIDVLEGTREAFTSRNAKYTDVVGRPS
ncbi:TrlF family AAA-like ATPase [Mycolicibacterium sp.]|uniref:TrlF family AAA-like ATPase n=1 Tax=Mycolicibacterium sp. TaxID=2320850 RepID=UPI001A1FC4DB|nr:AAA family ATPase [Mycolicibacterium sp.]MBJ7336050.1 hypothetical protein [Mycolicibacterium sp.]